MLIDEMRREMKLLPYTFYFVQSLALSLVFPAFSIFFARMATDYSDVSLSLFYCSFPSMMMGSQFLRLEYTTQFRTSAYKKGIVTRATAAWLFLLTIFDWMIFLLAYTVAKGRGVLTDDFLASAIAQFLIMHTIFCAMTVVQFKFSGVAYYVMFGVYVAVILAVVFGMRLFSQNARFPVPLRGIRLTLPKASGIAVAGCAVIALVAYALLRATYRRPVNTRQLDKAKF